MPPPLETERLILRPFTMDDLNEAYAVLEGHPDVWKYDPGFRRTREQRAALIRKYAEGNSEIGVGNLACVLKDTGALIGYAGLQLYLLPGMPFTTPEVELFYKLGREYWGCGYAYEACRELVRFAFDVLELVRIVNPIDARNRHSIHLMQRLGAKLLPGPEEWPQDMLLILDNNQIRE